MKETLINSIGIDFDGVIAEPFNGKRVGSETQRIPGSIEAIDHLKSLGFDPFVLTARSDKELPEVKRLIEHWAELIGKDFAWIVVTNKKLPAIMYIDDRAVRFTNWLDIMNLFAFRVKENWNE